MKVRYKCKNSGEFVYGSSGDFNTHGIGEAIVYFNDNQDGTPGGADSMMIHDLEVKIDDNWKPMYEAFDNKDIVPNNYNTHFGIPADQEARERGFNW